MSNLLKSCAVNFQGEEKRIINSNEIIARRLGLHIRQEEFSEGPENGEEDGMDEETERALFGERSGNIYREKPAYDGPSPEELVAAAEQEIAEMKAAAERETEDMRQRVLQEAQEQGYQEGYAQGQEKARQEAALQTRETERLRQSLEEEYERKLQELEPVMIEELTDIYDHVFAAGLKEKESILYHLLDSALHRIDSGREFIIRVSQADYEYMNGRQKELLEGMPFAKLDIVADVIMKRGEGMIETGGGIFDCSIDVELKELKERLRMLARGK